MTARNVKRREFIAAIGAGPVLLTACRPWLDEGISNPCLAAALPDDLSQHELILAALVDLDGSELWDCHVHLVGTGDSGSGIWINPNLRSLVHPLQYARFRFYLDAACLDPNVGVDQGYLQRLLALQDGLPQGGRIMLLAFDYNYDEAGQRNLVHTFFYIPDTYAAYVARNHPRRFEWIASIHPYRSDCIPALENAVTSGARAVKWLPNTMGINPGSLLCDRFYEAMVRMNIPLLVHSGDEHAVPTGEAQSLGNPLLLRRALDHGVRVIVAHCASKGVTTDIDKGKTGPTASNFSLFARMMDEVGSEDLLFGDISGLAQVNRIGEPLTTVIKRGDWHHRLLNGSDYPLPGVMPLYSMNQLVSLKFLTRDQANVLSAIRRHNPLLFDLVLKRSLRVNNQRFSPAVFHTRHIFERQANRPVA